MRAFFPALALLLVSSTACAYKKPPTMDFYLREAVWAPCFDSEGGQRVYRVEPASCPERSSVESTIRRARQNTGAELEDTWGMRIVFVPTRIWCDDAEWFGCAQVDATRADVVVTARPGAWMSVRHEAGHVIRFRRRGDADGGHRDCDFWRRLQNRDCGVWSSE